jgi:hypothetical protein
MLVRDGMTWGPRYVKVVAKLPQQETLFQATLGFPQGWDPTWGEDEVDFVPIARNKMVQALRAGASGHTSAGTPWLLEKGDYLAAGGVATNDRTLAIGVSGAFGLVDEAIAGVLLTTVCQLYRLRLERLQSGGAGRV